MFGFGLTEILIILVLVLIFFGAGRLPEIASALGKGVRSLRTAARERDAIDITPRGEGKKGESDRAQ